MNEVQDCVDQFQEVEAKHKFLSASLVEKRVKIEDRTSLRDDLVKARWVVSEVARLTQERFKERVETLVTMAIQSVFDRPFGFELVFEQKRNKMECRPVIYEMVGDRRVPYEDPQDDVGGSLIDIISFALRIVLWSLEKPSSRNVIILDEPMKNMGRLVSLGGRVLREVSSKLGFQLIIITHDQELGDIADRVFTVRHNGVFSEVSSSEKTKKKTKLLVKR
jgi:hypothetical protein